MHLEWSYSREVLNCILKTMDLKLHPDQSTRVMLHSRGHVKALAEHLFQNDPVGMKKVDAEFGEHHIIQPELVPEKPRDYTFHHIPQ